MAQKSSQQAMQELINTYTTLSPALQQELNTFLQTGNTQALSEPALRVIERALVGTPYLVAGQVQPLPQVAQKFWQDVRAQSVAGGTQAANTPAIGSQVAQAQPQQLGSGYMPSGTYGTGQTVSPGGSGFVGGGTQVAPSGTGFGGISQFVQRLLAGGGGNTAATGSTLVAPSNAEGGKTPQPTPPPGVDPNAPGYPGYTPSSAPAPAPVSTQGGGAEGGRTAPSLPPSDGSGGGGGTPAENPIVPGQQPTVPGGLTTTGAEWLAGHPEAQLAHALQTLGYDPTRPGQVGQFLASLLQPALEMQAKLGAFANGGNGMNYGAMQQATDSDKLAQMFMQKGTDAESYLRNMATSVGGNPSFLDFLSNPGGDHPEQNQYQMLQFLNQGRTTGLNPLIQSATQAAGEQAWANFNLGPGGFGAANGDVPASNNFLAWLQKQPPEVARFILGGGK